ncbi:MAG: AraC family transcriptional regulator [Paracoccaceae bacterium]|nr:AraC family transcriptional regulator [Paracoccaceae bacterium]
MSEPPRFLSVAQMPPPKAPEGEIRCGSYQLMAQAAPWRYSLLHDRSDNVLIWITRGQGRVILNGVRRGIGMNNALYLPAGTLFSFDLPAQVQALMVHSPAGLTGRLPREPVLLRVRDSLAQAELTSTIDAMNREVAQNRALLQEALEAHVRLIGVWLRRQITAGALDVPKPAAAQRLVRRFAGAVTRGFRDPRIMADYADALDVTPTHLTRACRDCCGKTAADILVERRLYEARHLLETTDQPIGDIAQALGFASAAYFTRFIKSHTGFAPSSLRRQSRKRA